MLASKQLQLVENLQRLGTVFANVLGSGCHLFESMSMTFANTSHETCVFTLEGTAIEFVVADKDTKKDGMSDCINGFTRVLEECLKKWTDFIKNERSQNHFLNLFTTKQIFRIQSELMKISRSSTVDGKLLLPLVSLVNANCNMKVVRKILKDRQHMDGGQ